MTTKKLAFLTATMVLLAAATVLAQTYDFEDGTDGQPVVSSIPGVVFEITGGQQWIYGDWRATDAAGAPKYQGPYPVGPYFSEGNFFAWLDTQGDTGQITLPEGTTGFAVAYSSPDYLTMDSYDSLATLIDTDTGIPNLNTGDMNLLMVEGNPIAYVVIGGASFGNYWLIDDMDTDATAECDEDSDCDDGLYCNGPELCIQHECVDSDPIDCGDDGLFCNGVDYCDEDIDACVQGEVPDCGDDGLFCNGEESCSEELDACTHSGFPCEPDELCDEERDICIPKGDPDEIILGGGCGCLF